METLITTSNASDFDFFIGRWNVAHRRLKERLANSNEWLEFTGSCITQKILGGLGNFDDNILVLPEGTYHAATIRSYNPASGTWSIWWLDGRNPGNLDVPVVGQFENGIGRFYAEDTFNGKAIRLRFLWTQPVPDMPRWEQAFSADAGETWETNWVMDFSRQA
ncbi:hypothetical protein AAKU64_003457 [Undibacterium sp. GrIS 1.8]|uniref:DUF1579 domain-containing protein n=1 Tax=unclassified Undibacterium TaxID=2630295 RepID=UPI003394F90B